MDTSTTIIFILVGVISVILILSVVHISAKVDEMNNYIRHICGKLDNMDKK